MKDLRDELKKLYGDSSKHSRYQNIPDFVRKELGYSEEINEEWRGDTARYRYILDEIKFLPGAVICDVGANTGFFTLSLGKLFKDSTFIAYEANKNHAKFIRLVKEYFGLDNVSVIEMMVNLENIDALRYHDILFLLNVLHHAGYDFDDDLNKRREDFKNYAREYLTRIRHKASVLVFQMGYNWGGDKQNPIIQKEDDAGKILYTSDLFMSSGWDIVSIALAKRDKEGTILYEKIPEHILNIIKDTKGKQLVPELESCVKGYNLSQFIGEFYRRPIFICNSRSGNSFPD